jgi:hypothetical protein
VIVQIGQQRGAGSAHRGMDIAVDPRRRHGRSLVAFRYRSCPEYRFLTARPCRASNVLPSAIERKSRA